MTKVSNFRLNDETLANLDAIAAIKGCNRTEAIRIAAGICLAIVSGKAVALGNPTLPDDTIEPPPSPVVPADAVTDDRNTIPDEAEVAVIYPDEAVDPTPPPPGPRFQATARPTFGPVQSLRSKPIAIPDLPNVHRSLNPITRGRLGS